MSFLTGMHDQKKPDKNGISRRRFLIRTCGLAGIGLGASHIPAAASESAPGEARYPIGVSDWMILKRQKLGAFPLAAELGCDGVEVDMGPLGNRTHFEDALTDPGVQKQFLDAAASRNLRICSLSMSGFYAQSFTQRPGAVEMVKSCIGHMQKMGIRIAFLPLGVQDDLSKFPALRPQVIKRLREVAAPAEKAGVVIGIETSLNAEGERKLLSDIGSPAIRSYYNFERPLQTGRDLIRELEILGREYICQIHCTDTDGSLLRDDPLINLPAVHRALDAMGWRGWLVMQRSRDQRDVHNIRHNYGSNARYLREIFGRG